MSSKNTVKENIVYNSAYNILTIIIPLILTPYLSRVLGVEGVGVYSFTLAVANYFKRTSMLGMEKYGNRGIALVKENQEKRKAAFWAIYKVQLACCIICCLLYLLYLKTMDTRGLPALLQGLFVLSSVFDVSWYFFGDENFKPVVIISSVSKLAYMLLTFVFVNNQKDVNAYIAIAALSYLIPNIIIFLMAVAKEKYTKSSIKELTIILKGTLVLFIPVIAVTVYKSMDKVMLGIICETAYENGLYENAEKILHVPIAVISAVSTVLMPRMTRLYRDNDDNRAGEYIYTTIKYAAFMSIACACGLAGISEIFSDVYWGEAFRGCAILLIMFSVSIPFMSFAEIIRTQYIIPNKQDKVYIVAVCIGAAVNLFVNMLLIPKMGSKGAVIGTIVAEASVCVYQSYKVRKELPIKKYCKVFAVLMLPGLVMAFIVFATSRMLSHTVLNLVAVIMLGAASFSLICLGVIYICNKDEYVKISTLLRRILVKKTDND